MKVERTEKYYEMQRKIANGKGNVTKCTKTKRRK
jgi:hypothetical protein